MRRILVLGTLVVCAMVTTTISARQQRQRAQIGLIAKVKDNLYVIKNSDPTDRSTFTGGNVAVFVTEAGVVLVDTKLAGYGQDILLQVRSVTPKPVTMIINTHTHNDHTGSNTEFAATVEYVAHENTKANLSRETCAPVTNCQSFKGENAKFLPKRTFKDKLTLGAGRDQIDLFYFGRGHTNGDTWVVFPAVRTMHTGDMFQRKNMPFIDYENSGGSAVEFASTQSRAIATIKNVDTIIPGHFNGIMTWDDFKQGVAFYADFLSSVQKSMKEGRSAEQAAVSWKIPERFQDFQTDAARVKSNVEGIYAELSKNRGR